VDPSKVEVCSEQAKRAEKEASDTKSKVPKFKDLVNSMNCEFKTLAANHKMLKAQVK
jgi:hypothetical protein